MNPAPGGREDEVGSQPTDAAATRSLAALRWRCRRGLLENDLALAAFLDSGYAALDARGHRAFERLLEFSDAELLGMLLGRAECRDAELRPVMLAIRAAARQPPDAGDRVPD